jgi:hypothetical protein
MPASWYPCPHCGKRGAQLIRRLPTQIHYFCGACVTEFVERTDDPTDATAVRITTPEHLSIQAQLRRKHVIA